MAFATHCANTPRTFGHVLFIPDNFQELEREFRVESSIGSFNGFNKEVEVIRAKFLMSGSSKKFHKSGANA